MSNYDKVKSSQQGKETIKNAIKQEGLTQDKLATQANISLDTLKRLIWTKDVKDNIPASVDRFAVENIAQVLKLKPTDIVDPKEWQGDKLFKYRQKFNALLEDKQRHFVGRKFVFDAIDDFINNHNKGYFTIIAKPGEGKSSIIANYVDGETRYKVYHKSFADFLNSNEMVQLAGVEITNIHGLIADRLWQELYGDDEE
ncbi:MAG TPA: hypothetical protein DCF68_10775 [Cyanothece sp. UBA12306]|nr:hypothetical protein [Cyanothece sp. UBA12306]